MVVFEVFARGSPRLQWRYDELLHGHAENLVGVLVVAVAEFLLGCFAFWPYNKAATRHKLNCTMRRTTERIKLCTLP